MNPTSIYTEEFLLYRESQRKWFLDFGCEANGFKYNPYQVAVDMDIDVQCINCVLVTGNSFHIMKISK